MTHRETETETDKQIHRDRNRQREQHAERKHACTHHKLPQERQAEVDFVHVATKAGQQAARGCTFEERHGTPQHIGDDFIVQPVGGRDADARPDQRPDDGKHEVREVGQDEHADEFAGLRGGDDVMVGRAGAAFKNSHKNAR